VERIDAIVEMNNSGVWILGSADDDDGGAGLGMLVGYAGKGGRAIVAKPSRTRGLGALRNGAATAGAQ
jgi:hypothetical protein